MDDTAVSSAATRELNAVLGQAHPAIEHVRACLEAGADPWVPADRGMSAVEKLLARWRDAEKSWAILQMCLEKPPARRLAATDPRIGKVLRQGFRQLDPSAMVTWKQLLGNHLERPADLPVQRMLEDATSQAMGACRGIGKLKPASAQGLRAVLAHHRLDVSWLDRWAPQMRNWNILAIVLEQAQEQDLLCQQGWQPKGWAWKFLANTYDQDARSMILRTFQSLPPAQRQEQTPALLSRVAEGSTLSALPSVVKKAARWMEGCPNACVQRATGRPLFAWLVQSTEETALKERYADMTTSPAKFLQMQGKVLADLVLPNSGIQDCTGAWEAWRALSLSQYQRLGEPSDSALLAAATALLDRGVVPPFAWEELPFWGAERLPLAWRALPERIRALCLEQTMPQASPVAPRIRL